MKMLELAETFCEVDDFLEVELDHFLGFLISKGITLNKLNEFELDSLVKEYITKANLREFNPSERFGK